MSSCVAIFSGRSLMICVLRFVLFPEMQICSSVTVTALDEATRYQIYTDIHEDSEWLIGVVENLLSITRLNDGRLKFKFTDQLLDEVMRNHSDILAGSMMRIRSWRTAKNLFLHVWTCVLLCRFW